jgi:hypothetical protein
VKINDTYGEITDQELAEMRADAATCTICGMLATVDPVLHTSRYGHTPAIREGGRELTWSVKSGWKRTRS